MNKKLLIIIFCVVALLAGCQQKKAVDVPEIIADVVENVAIETKQTDESAVEQETDNIEELVNLDGGTVAERFNTPKGYKRVETEQNSFGDFLQNLPLKPPGTKVKYFDGREKMRDVYLAVADYDLGNRDLQQCADSIIRLKAEYLYFVGKYNEIHFDFVSGFNADFSKWADGYGISVDGNNVTWAKNANNNDTYESFKKYLDIVYAYASTLSLEREMVSKELEDLEIGDVFIKGGSPGHCVIVVDMAVNEETGGKIFMLAQGYMPAQDIQILKGNNESSPWYSLDTKSELITPEWAFDLDSLKTWEIR